MSEPKLPIGLRVIAVTTLTLGCIGGCSDWDAAVGVRCSEYPSFCRREEADSGRSIEIDGGLDGSTEVDGSGPRAKTVSFRSDIRPLMDRAETDPSGPGCSSCHYRTRGTQQGINEGQLDLTTLGALRRGGKTAGADRIVVPGRPEQSALLLKLRGTYSIGSRMPWNGPPYWSDAEIKRVETWIAEGATGADDE